ncbi:uncharacterized protein LOC117225041 [Megalopta genalis]|uniref:uncharacterized protein LOC117225041 n=1 Tax=Megalopta genalis TaxID=115081 RepID=UPI003FD2D0BD
MALSSAMKLIQLFIVHLLLVYSVLGRFENKLRIAKTETTELTYKERVIDREKCHDIQWHETDCMPRDTFVKLKPKLGFSYHPDIVKTKVCTGFCDTRVTCIATETKTREVPILAVNHGMSGDDYCYNITIEEHTMCKCLCTMMEHHCNKDQTYDEDNCSCECNANKSDRWKCERQENMMWDDEKCMCSCNKVTEECSSGYYWVPSECRCMKLM